MDRSGVCGLHVVGGPSQVGNDVLAADVGSIDLIGVVASVEWSSDFGAGPITRHDEKSGEARTCNIPEWVARNLRLRWPMIASWGA